jgi:hypothetical protein
MTTHVRGKAAGLALLLVLVTATLFTLQSPAGAASHAWSQPKLVAGGKGLTSLSCVSAKFCMGVTTKGEALRYTGKHWTAKKIDHRELTAVSCVSSHFCVAVDFATNKGNGSNGYNSYGLIFKGSKWSAPKRIWPGALDTVSCRTKSFCVAADANGAGAVKFNGHSWKKTSTVHDSQFLQSVSCATKTFCMVVDPDTFGTPAAGGAVIFNGHKWGSRKVVDHTQGFLNEVSCATPHLCVAGDGPNFDGKDGGHVFRYDGSSWKTTILQKGGGSISSVSCPLKSSSCTVGAGNGEVSSLTKNGWTKLQRIDGKRAIAALSCIKSGFCVAADRAGHVVIRHS